MNDIESELCELPTGVTSLEFLPSHQISGWENGIPRALERWYNIGVYRRSLTYAQPTEDTVHGNLTRVNVGCLVVNDSQAAADQLDQMGQMNFVLRITHYDGKIRYIGTPGEFVRLTTTEFTPDEIVGAQGYKMNFSGSFIRRPIVI